MDNARDLRRNVWLQSSARLAVCMFGEVPRSGFPFETRYAVLSQSRESQHTYYSGTHKMPSDARYEGLVGKEMDWIA